MNCGESKKKKPKKKSLLVSRRYKESRKYKNVDELNSKRFVKAFSDQKMETRMQVMTHGPHPKVRSRKESWEMTWKEAIELLRSSSAVYKD